MSQRPPLLILGMHRSGTSALSRAMNICGWQLAARIMPPSPGNPAGYWEPIEIVRFNDRLLKTIGSHWADPRPLPEGWSERPEVVAMHGEARDILEAEFPSLDGIVLKDPRFSRLLPFWERVFEGCAAPPACLIMSRHPFEVAQSLALREQMDLRHGMLLWLAYMLDAEGWSRGRRRATVDYNALLADWRGSLEPTLDAVWPEARPAMEAGADELDAFLDKGHRHFAEEADDLPAAGPAATLIGRTLDWFRRADATVAEIDAIRADWLAYWERPEAEAECAAMMEALPSHHFEIATQLKAEGALPEALQEIDRAIEGAPGTTNYHARRGEILSGLERFEEAAAAFERAIEIGGFNPNQLRNLCEACAECGRGDRAVAALRGALGKAPNIPWLASRLGAKLADSGHTAEAQAMIEIALEGDPENDLHHEGHSKLLEKIGRREEAIEAMRRAIAYAEKPRYKKRLKALLAARD
ncbi:MAG: tetratricopeptide repeat protein [Parasphingopyxis sp.]|nr:tetratricopeptide repeat protein [Sphingomonadales bacterium]